MGRGVGWLAVLEDTFNVFKEMNRRLQRNRHAKKLIGDGITFAKLIIRQVVYWTEDQPAYFRLVNCSIGASILQIAA